MKKFQFGGTGVALVTPFFSGAVDFDSLGAVIDHVISGGVNYIVLLGSTGEAATLTDEEKREIVSFSVKHINRRVPIVVGFGGNDTAAIIRLMNDFNLEDVDGILSQSPHYNKPTQEGIYSHFMELDGAATKPIILYNVPSRTGSNMTAETTARIGRESKNIVAIKEASGNLSQCMEIERDAPEDFVLLSGDDRLTLPMISFGAQGVISVIANALPKQFCSMVRTALDGNFKEAWYGLSALLEIDDMMYIEGNPTGVKSALQSLGVIKSREARSPLMGMTNENHKKLAHLISTLD